MRFEGLLATSRREELGPRAHPSVRMAGRRHPGEHAARGERSTEARWRMASSERVVEDEDRRRNVGLDVVGAEKSEDLLTGEPLHDCSEVGFHLLAEEAAQFGHVAPSPFLREDLLGLRQHVVHQRDDHAAAVKCRRGRGPATKVLGLDPHQRVCQSRVQFATPQTVSVHQLADSLPALSAWVGLRGGLRGPERPNGQGDLV